jgi:hypothetical protein
VPNPHAIHQRLVVTGEEQGMGRRVVNETTSMLPIPKLSRLGVEHEFLADGGGAPGMSEVCMATAVHLINRKSLETQISGRARDDPRAR